MPIKPENRALYPANWQEIRAAILQRARGRCEWCGVPNYAVGHRDEHGQFVPTGGNAAHDAAGRGELPYAEARALADHGNEWEDGPRLVVIVLTVAHVDNADPADCRPENLAALCQRCHNRHDQAMRHRHAAATRREARERWQLRLEVA